MKITYDKIADAAYMVLRKGKVAKTVEMSESVIIDLDKKAIFLALRCSALRSNFPRKVLLRMSRLVFP